MVGGPGAAAPSAPALIRPCLHVLCCFTLHVLINFTRLVWGINSSPYIALFAIERLVNENPTNAGQLALTAIENNRFMDD